MRPTACNSPAASVTLPAASVNSIPALARAGVAAGVDALFMEVHEDPDHAKSDGPNSLDLKDFEGLLRLSKRSTPW